MFAEAINLAKIDNKILEHNAFVTDSQEKGQIYWDILEFTTPGFYEGNDKSFVATQPKSEINEERVKYFEDKIGRGERPFIIIFNSNFTEYMTNIDNSITRYSMNSENYVLDGHHKLLAYQNLKINPPIVEITHQPKTKDEIEFDIEKLIDVMYPWQIEHILVNGYSQDENILEAVKNPKSKIYNLIKNGFHKEFYENGQLKHEAFYVNNRIEGEGKWWFDNGQLQKNEFYKNGRMCNTWISWYKSGQIHYKHSFNEQGQMDGHWVEYFENGKISSEQFIKNGVYLDGDSYSRWHENGNKEAELKYLKGQLIIRKNYDQSGQLINFEGFDFKSQKLVQRKIKQRLI
jgi:antitoxin component YwqK of YwqJK toxin-antitoxin module